MLPKNNRGGNSRHEIDTDYLLDLCRELADELTELKRYTSLIYSAWTAEDTTLRPTDDWFSNSDDQLDKVYFLLGLFCQRFPAKDIKDLEDNAHKIHELVLEITKHSSNNKS